MKIKPFKYDVRDHVWHFVEDDVSFYVKNSIHDFIWYSVNDSIHDDLNE